MSTSGSGEVYDVVVIGGGIVGLSTAYHLTRDNTRLRVLLVEQFIIPHTRGSSNSGSRLIAKYTYPNDVYISMVTAAYDQWRDIERRSGVELLRKTGMLQIEDKPGDRTAGSVAAIEKDGVAYRLFGGSQASTVHAGVCYDDSCQVLHEFSPGVLRANKCILALKNLVERQGGTILEDTQVTDVVPGDVVTVTTAGGSYRSKSVVIAAGPWVNMLLKNRGIQLPVKTMPGFQFFWKIKEGFRFSASEGAPLIKHWTNKQEGYQFVFVIPEWEYPGLVKVATRFEPHNDYISPNERDQIDSSRLKQKLSEYIRKHLHFLEPTAVLLEPCMYTMTPDKHFIIDRLPGCNNIIVGAGMSGHGFQSAPEIGRVLAEMSQGHPTSHDVSMLSLKRFASKGQRAEAKL